jgi:hypothetical protein
MKINVYYVTMANLKFNRINVLINALRIIMVLNLCVYNVAKIVKHVVISLIIVQVVFNLFIFLIIYVF